jgi:hypothetical protein
MAPAWTDHARRCDQCGGVVPAAGRVIVLGASSGAAGYERVYCTPDCLSHALRSASEATVAWDGLHRERWSPPDARPAADPLAPAEPGP